MTAAIVFVVWGALLALAERRAPARPRRRLVAALRRELPYVVVASALPAAAVGALGAAFAVDGPLGAAPATAQWLAVLAVTELSFYAVHRALHHRWLWRLHRVHHEPADLDWIAGHRKHVGEALLHGLAPLPLLVALAPSPAVLAFHAGVGVAMTAFTHANLGLRLGWLEAILVTPRYHAWHHAADAQASGKNLAGKLAVLDRLFGTRHDAPGWPAAVGSP
jgi:lathosterol oxidase